MACCLSNESRRWLNEAALHRSRWSTLRARLAQVEENWVVGKRTLKALALVTAIAEHGEGNKIMINQLSASRVVVDIKPECPERVNPTNLASHCIANHGGR